ncbi:MAG: hypothetical protein ATN31_09660 [Candidatus Epulonipiscioides saccharophilum]|nr:MAG: hypothetical protein ATN31_09660 [Epulopiscium sp. AS2M-Bin001]
MNLSIIFTVVLIIHYFMFFELLNVFLECKLKKSSMIMLGLILILVIGPSSVVLVDLYDVLIIYLLLTVSDFIIIATCFKGNLLFKIAISLYMPTNLIAISEIITSVINISALSSKFIITEVNLFYITRIGVGLIHSLFMFVVIKKILSKNYQALLTNKSKVKIFVGISITIAVCVFADNLMYNINNMSTELYMQQIILNVSWLIMFHVCAFILLASNFINRNENTAGTENMYKNMLLNKVDIAIEIDCSTRLCTNFIHKGEVQHNIIGFSYDEYFKKFLSDYIHVQDLATVKIMANINYMSELFKKGITNYQFEYRFLTSDNEFSWFNVDVNMELQGTLKAILIITNIQEAKDIKFNAERDLLTGLYNKEITRNKINQARELQKDGYLFMIDLDNFKTVNDLLGHTIGDTVLRDVSIVLNSLFRDSDIKGRIGGDEFIVYVIGSNNINIDTKSKRLVHALTKVYARDDIRVKISPSIGIVKVDTTYKLFKDIYSDADQAMYISKNKGKATYTVFVKEKEDNSDNYGNGNNLELNKYVAEDLESNQNTMAEDLDVKNNSIKNIKKLINSPEFKIIFNKSAIYTSRIKHLHFPVFSLNKDQSNIKRIDAPSDLSNNHENNASTQIDQDTDVEQTNLPENLETSGGRGYKHNV